MNLESWLLFCTLSLLTAFSPGPAVLLAVANAGTHGLRRALAGSLGNMTGIFVVSATAMLGLGALLKASAFWFGMLKFAGAGYLIWLGIRQWRRRAAAFDDAPAAAAVGGSRRRLFAQGLTVAAANPKSILFLTALLPQFMRTDAPLLQQYLSLTATFALCALLAHLCYGAIAHALRRWLRGTRGRWFDRLSGAVFVAMGLGLLGLRRQAA
ncbi:LysE family translocator [Luteimonas sp. RD2P54]|uniref:LysE family translocator n=1 Tax=Luteimonas endophytica TaxID=3042023 RepID=A0ABT6J7J7_9GAMM|nr:LysE family translocator [Luteimonas endophytica]MDH5822797.1 LysE family translocator [Luteimonas endophytica]